MKNHRVAIRYAKALLALAEERELLDRTEKEFLETRLLIERHPEITRLLRNTTLSREEKEDFIGKVLPEGFSSLVTNFLKVLIRKGRFEELSLVQEKFHQFYEIKKGREHVRVETAVRLDETLQEKLRRALEKKLKRTVTLEMEVRPEILGGLVLDFDGIRMDGSFRTTLQELKQKLMNLRG